MKFNTILTEGLGFAVITTKENIENFILYQGQTDNEVEYEEYKKEVYEQEKYNYM